jgi:hypothetical protein
VSTGRRDLKPPKASSFPLSSLIVSWKTSRNASSSAPLNHAKGKCNCDGINHSRNGRDKIGDEEP